MSGLPAVVRDRGSQENFDKLNSRLSTAETELATVESKFPVAATDLATSSKELFLQLAVAASRKIAFGTATIKFSASGISETVTIEHGLGVTPIAIGGTVEGGEATQFVSAPRLSEPASSTKIKVFMNGAAAYTATFTWRWFAIG